MARHVVAHASRPSLRWPFLAGPLATLATILAGLAVDALVPGVREASPAILMVPAAFAVVYAAFVGGLRPGLASAAMVVGFNAFLFLDEVSPFPDPRARTIAFLVASVAVVGVALLVGFLHLRASQANARAVAHEHAYALGLEREKRSLVRANEGLEAFTYVVSHDLKEPIRAVEAYLAALDEDYGASLPREGKENLARALDANRRLEKLVRNLLDLGRAIRLDVSRLAPVSLEDAFKSEACQAVVAPAIAERRARVEIDVPPDVPPVLATPPALAQVLANLVLNAVRHNPKPEPLVRLRARSRASADLVEVGVEDDGPGFSANARARLDLSMRGGLPASIGHGGFGLAITRRAVERLGGELWFATSPEGGASVRFTLPAFDPEGHDVSDGGDGAARAVVPETEAARASRTEARPGAPSRAAPRAKRETRRKS